MPTQQGKRGLHRTREKRQRLFRRGIAPEAFARELARQIRGRGESFELLIRAFPTHGRGHSKNLLRQWADGELLPRWPSSFRLLNRIEQRFGLPKNHFKKILRPRSHTQRVLDTVVGNQYQYFRLHLPDDFDDRSSEEQLRIKEWVQKNIISAGTDYGKFIRDATSTCYCLRFPAICDIKGHSTQIRPSGTGLPPLDAPGQLVDELRDLVAFKRGAIAPPGFRRFSGWTKSTAYKQVRSIGRMFGALTATPDSIVKGFGAPATTLTMALFVFPAFWDWYLDWREHRRGILHCP
jgi:hypothetical protein